MVFFVKYLHSTGHNQKRFGKVDKLYGGEKDFKDETALVKLKIFAKKKKKNINKVFLLLKKEKIKYNFQTNTNESSTNKYQTHVACRYGYKLMYVMMIRLVSLSSNI